MMEGKNLDFLDTLEILYIYQEILDRRTLKVYEMLKKSQFNGFETITELATLPFKLDKKVSTKILFVRTPFNFSPIYPKMKRIFRSLQLKVPTENIDNTKTYVFTFPPFRLGMYELRLYGLSDISIIDDPETYIAINIHPKILSEGVFDTIIHEFTHMQLRFCNKWYCKPDSEKIVRKIESMASGQLFNSEVYEQLKDAQRHYFRFNNIMKKLYSKFEPSIMDLYSILSRQAVIRTTVPTKMNLFIRKARFVEDGHISAHDI